ncbi:hypothetical protein Back2_08960 [Nocardioides baekrokdamisoli]|uniref:Uncharacterized protein n=1 Tax=Nocardioides baekrokdamisoli TaxID=1804624 RepID=A0A3G9J0X6_9ACTN|nr:hypothetical protein Back2_08960 [Nocardioides baekrokdamisoli]
MAQRDSHEPDVCAVECEGQIVGVDEKWQFRGPLWRSVCIPATAADPAQARALNSAARAQSVCIQAIHVATDEDRYPIPIVSVLNRSA